MAKWSRERIIREILRREASDQSLDLGAADPVESSLYQAAQRVFGSWRNAVVAAGISPNKARVHDPWPPSRILASIRSLARRTRPLQPAEVKRRYEPLVTAARRHFGSWPKAVVAAGVDPEKLRRVSRWTKQRIIEAILTRALRGKRLNSSAVRPQSLVEAGTRVFNSWESALEAAGIDPGQASRRPPIRGSRARWSEEEILLAVRTRLRENKKMNAAAVEENDGPLYRLAKRRYGSWRGALLAAGLNPDDFRSRTVSRSV
jgi:hypothetical protein